ncbi:hypothetical protein TIFTF001_029452 [Ficus carica]|uniref:Uncharacterized protein n=1 Tax=Ficus carica TaxID=3494 RepID=A0AA88DRR9_FICCA|nr:hypothetical protein TIFTF001_029452 [Ficus carica]
MTTLVALRLSGRYQHGVGFSMVPTLTCQVSSGVIVDLILEIGGPTDKGSPMRAWPYGGFMVFSDLGTRHPNFLYGGAIRLTFLSRSSPWSEGIAL